MTGCCGACSEDPAEDMYALGFEDRYEFGTEYDETCDFCGVTCEGTSSFALTLKGSILAIAALLMI